MSAEKGTLNKFTAMSVVNCRSGLRKSLLTIKGVAIRIFFFLNLVLQEVGNNLYKDTTCRSDIMLQILAYEARVKSEYLMLCTETEAVVALSFPLPSMN